MHLLWACFCANKQCISSGPHYPFKAGKRIRRQTVCIVLNVCGQYVVICLLKRLKRITTHIVITTMCLKHPTIHACVGALHAQLQVCSGNSLLRRTLSYLYTPHTCAAPGPQRDEPPEEGTVHKATVRRIEPYGVFVQLDGFRKQGLVHSSQVQRGGGGGEGVGRVT